MLCSTAFLKPADLVYEMTFGSDRAARRGIIHELTHVNSGCVGPSKFLQAFPFDLNYPKRTAPTALKVFR